MWSKTLNLPHSQLAKRSDPLKSLKLFPKVTTSLYKAQKQLHQGDAEILHDGPPYANGSLHLGHALNKILKDLINRSRVLDGKKISYVPGWDCHGLPIELKAVSNNKSLNSWAIRSRARKLATKMMNLQAKEFESYCLMTDFENRYVTMSTDYVVRELKLFKSLMEKGLIKRKNKPVYWSPHSQTALAESELVYDEIVQTACYAAYPVTGPTDTSSSKYLLIWTTTPWTLPGNEAIAIHRDLKYVEVKVNDKVLIVAEDAFNNQNKYLASILDNGTVKRTFEGSELENMEYTCPLRRSKHKVLHADYVTSGGTGLVHTSPGHGKDDYQLGVKHNLPVYSAVDDAGVGIFDSLNKLCGIEGSLKETHKYSPYNDTFPDLSSMSNFILGTHPYSHSVPHDWRSKTPVIMRATPQFFLELGDVSVKALKTLDSVKFVPPSSRARLEAFIKTRSDWCISRQRSWGVPIPVLLDKYTGEPVTHPDFLDHIIGIIEKEGPDSWFQDALVDKWIPEKYKSLSDDLVKCTDTLDVWLDSGSSFLSEPLGTEKRTTYVEGSDQHRGWFQSSLLLHTAMYGTAPFATLVTHGFLLDKFNQKMSKSEGNVVKPEELINKIGVDGLRLLVAQSDYTSDISLHNESVNQVAALLKKIRLTFKFLLGNLDEKTTLELPSELSSLDKYILNSLQELVAHTQHHFKELDFQNFVRELQFHMNGTLSAVYFDAVKDTLYADSQDSTRRQAVQYVLAMILATYTRLLAPLVPLITQEVWDISPISIKNGSDTPLLAGYPSFPEIDYTGVTEPVLLALKVRDMANECLELAKKDKLATSLLPCDIYVHSSDDEIDTDLVELICVASHAYSGMSQNPLRQVSKDGLTVSIALSNQNKCERCWKHNAEETLCKRCATCVDGL